MQAKVANRGKGMGGGGGRGGGKHCGGAGYRGRGDYIDQGQGGIGEELCLDGEAGGNPQEEDGQEEGEDGVFVFEGKAGTIHAASPLWLKI